MASTVSDTDLKLFIGLANPEKTNADVGDDDDTEGEDGEDEYDEDELDEVEEERGSDGVPEEEDEEDDEVEEDELPDLSGGRPAPSVANSTGRFSAAADSPPPVEMSKEELDYAKTSVLLELERLRGMGCKLTRDYGMHDSLEEMEYEARRHVLLMEEQNNVNMMKDGLRLFVSGAEFANGKFGPFLNLDGFSQSFSSELTTGKYNMTLTKLHRKYFKTPVQSSPEMELAMGLLGAAAMHHFQRSYMHKIVPQQRSSASGASFMPNVPPAADDDSDEDLPPNFGT